MPANTFDIILCDMQLHLVRAWTTAFASHDIEIIHGDILDVEADAYVSPANGFGIMDGGIDAALSARFPGVQRRVQAAIYEIGPHLPVGRAVIVETEDPFVPYLVSAPTMLYPSHVGHTRNAEIAMSALLHAIEEFNATNHLIASVVIPGLATGVGGMHPERAAQQMASAYIEWTHGLSSTEI
jgi:O-acetyl-ADP-ribose deacetylase (regulator of RNase III)